MESLGLWSSSSVEVLKDIARKTTLTSGQTISKALTNLHEHLSVCVWKYNGRMLFDRLAVSHNSDLWDTLVEGSFVVGCSFFSYIHITLLSTEFSLVLHCFRSAQYWAFN